MNTEEKKLNDLFDDEMEIDLLELLFVLKQKLLLLIAAFVVGAAVVGLYTARFVAPTYRTAATIYISTKTTSITSLADLQIGSQLAVDFQIVATTREVLENVVEKLGLDMTYEEIRAKVNITTPQGSHMLKITATDTDPQRATDIANTLADELRLQIADVMNTEMPSMVERAVVPIGKVGPFTIRNAILAGFTLVVGLSGVIVVLHLMDDSIHTEEDIKKYLKLNNLAMIPVDKSRTDRENQRKKQDKLGRKK